jgi:glucose-1-phosphate adenylyltransferase
LVKSRNQDEEFRMKSTTAVILAGGRGKRMDIFCQQRPKPLLPFAGQYRVIDFTLSNCLNSGIKDIAALVDHQRAAMTEYLGRWSSRHMGKNQMAILPPGSTSYAGTADAVFQNLAYINRQKNERVIILAGDHVYKMDYGKMLAFHEEHGADVTVSVIRVPFEDAHRFGTCLAEPDGRINGFEEKSENPRSNLASMGIYVFNREYLDRVLTKDAENLVSIHDFGYAVLPQIVKQDRVFAYEFSDYWQDIGTVEAYYAANRQFLPADPVLATGKSWPVLSASEGLFLPVQTPGAKIVNSLISPGCHIKGQVENSILSPGVQVEEGARVINSIVMAGTRIGASSIVDHCILDEGVDIGRFCYLGFGKSTATDTASIAAATAGANITLVGKDVFVPPQTAIGRNSKVLPGLSLAERGSRLVPPGTVVAVP